MCCAIAALVLAALAAWRSARIAALRRRTYVVGALAVTGRGVGLAGIVATHAHSMSVNTTPEEPDRMPICGLFLHSEARAAHRTDGSAGSGLTSNDVAAAPGVIAHAN